jgi:hypothetical protein
MAHVRARIHVRIFRVFGASRAITWPTTTASCFLLSAVGMSFLHGSLPAHIWQAPSRGRGLAGSHDPQPGNHGKHGNRVKICTVTGVHGARTLHSLHAHAGYAQKGLSHTPWQMLTACLRFGSPGLLWRSGSSTISSPLSTEGRFQKFSSVLGFDISSRVSAFAADLAAKVRAPRFVADIQRQSLGATPPGNT